MSGRRELMAALEPKIGKPFDYSGQEELWLDYVADTGDGWNATTSVAEGVSDTTRAGLAAGPISRWSSLEPRLHATTSASARSARIGRRTAIT